MKILVFAHQLEVGGTQTNAIELAAALRDLHGHDVVIFATPGPMSKLIEKKSLRYVPAPDAFVHPSPSRVRALRGVVRQERPDLIHAWDWWQCLDTYYLEHALMRIPMIVSDMMMTLTRILPKSPFTTFGTPELVDQAKAAGRRRAELLLPPVDVHWNAPDAAAGRDFRERHGIAEGDITLVTVSRLEHDMKAESLYRTIAAVRALGREFPLRFVVVGDGRARAEVERRASETNADLGRPAVVLAGPLLDPRPAYAAADVFIGMGGSALKAMAFAKPVIIVGEQGFSKPFTSETAEFFYYRGMFGRGDGSPGNEAHVSDIRRLVSRRNELAALGQFAQQFVHRHYSMEAVSAHLT